MKKITELVTACIVMLFVSCATSTEIPEVQGDFDWKERVAFETENENFSGIPRSEINMKDNSGCTVLFYAIQSGPEAVQTVVKSGADVNLPCNDDGDLPLIYASGFWNHEESAKCLVLNKAKLSLTDEDGNTPLHIAAINGRKDLCAFYLDHGAKLEAKNKDGETPFLTSCYELGGHGDDKQGTRMLLAERGANVKAVSKDGDNAFNYLFICYSDGFGLNYAIYPDSELLKLLIKNGVNINNKGSIGYPIFGCVKASVNQGGIDEYIRELASLGADLEVTDSNGYTPLAFAVGNADIAATGALLEKGADLNKIIPETDKTIRDIISDGKNNKWVGDIFDDIDKLVQVHLTKDKSVLKIPEDTIIERKNGKTVYYTDAQNVFEIINNITEEENPVLKIKIDTKKPGSKVIDPYSYTQRILSSLKVPVSLDLTECNPEFIISEYYFDLKNVHHVIFSDYTKKDENDSADIYKFRLSDYPDLEEVIIPKGIKKIDRYSFTFMDKLESIVVPATVEEIREEAFYNCASLKKIVLKNRNVKIEENAISKCPEAQFIYE